MKKGLLVTAYCWACFFGAFAWVQAEETEEMELTADSIEYDMKTGGSVYRGGVMIKRGGFEVHGEVVEIDGGGEDGGIRELRVVEGPGFVRLPAEGGSLEGRAQRISYDAEKQLLHLSGGAEVVRSGQKVTGEDIFYDLVRGSLKVEGGGAGRARLNLEVKKAAEPAKRPERVERTERTERSGRTERAERSERSERTERLERMERMERERPPRRRERRR